MYILEEACKDASFAATILFSKKLIDIIFIVGPILLILLLTIDFSKAVMASDDNKIQQVKSTAIKRILFAILLLFVPLIVDTAFSLLDKDKGNVISCYNKVDNAYVDNLAAKLEADTKEKEAQREKDLQDKKAYQKSQAEKRSAVVTKSSGTSSSNTNTVNVGNVSVKSTTKKKKAKGTGYDSQITLGNRTFKLYKQCGVSYSKNRFGHNVNNIDCSICNCGCGPVALATILSGYGYSKNPSDVGNGLIKSAKAAGVKDPTSSTAIGTYVSSLGFKTKHHSSSKLSDKETYTAMRNSLLKGHTILLYVGKSKPGRHVFSRTGYHFISILAIDSKNDKVFVTGSVTGERFGWYKLSDVSTARRPEKFWREIYK